MATRSLDLAVELYEAKGDGEAAALLSSTKEGKCLGASLHEESFRGALDEAREMVAQSRKKGTANAKRKKRRERRRLGKGKGAAEREVSALERGLADLALPEDSPLTRIHGEVESEEEEEVCELKRWAGGWAHYVYDKFGLAEKKSP